MCSGSEHSFDKFVAYNTSSGLHTLPSADSILTRCRNRCPFEAKLRDQCAMWRYHEVDRATRVKGYLSILTTFVAALTCTSLR